MPDNLIIAKQNAFGLSRDVEIVRSAIEAAGGVCGHVEPRARSWSDRLTGRTIAQHAFHIERVFPQWFTAAQKHYLIPNQERFPRRHLGRLRGIDHVLAKTHHAETIFASHGKSSSHIGFASPDRLDRTVQRERRFLHVAGGSTLKGTEDVLRLWSRHPEWPALVVVQREQQSSATNAANITLLSGYQDDATLKEVQNACAIHICPSRSEGWGHYIVEALSCGATVITTDAPPMNEHIKEEFGLLVPHDRSEARHLGTNFFAGSAALERAVLGAIDLSGPELEHRGKLARDRFETISSSFTENFAEFVATH